MRPVRAADALAPAFERARLILFSPLRIGRSWKLAATGYLSWAGILFLPFPLCYLLPLAFVPPLGHRIAAGIIAAAVVLTVLFVFLFHLCSRLGFAFFDIVLNHGEFVTSAWRLYGPQSRRWTVCKVLYGCVVTILLAAPIAAYIRRLIPLFAAMTRTPNQPPSPEFFFALFSGYFFVFAGVFFFGGIAVLANDFIVPSLALENTTLREAFSRLIKLIRVEPGQFALYALLKFVAVVVGYTAINFATQVVLFLAVAVIAVIGGAIGLLLHIAGVSLTALWITAGVIGIPLLVGLSLYLTLFAAGILATFLQAYLLCFLGGRYPMLGDLLDRSTPPPLVPMPPAKPWPPEFGTPMPPPQTP